MSKTFPAERAVIFWNTWSPALNDREWTGVVIADKSTKNPEMEEGYGGVSVRHFMSSTGAMTDGWCVDGFPLNYPEGVFISILKEAPPTDDALEQILGEFSKISECEWARRMLEAHKIVTGKSGTE